MDKLHFKFHLQIFDSVGNEDNIKENTKEEKVTGPTEHYYLNVRQANNTKTKHSLQATECEAEKEFSQNKDVFVSFFLHVQKREGSFFFPLKKRGKKKEEEKKTALAPANLPSTKSWPRCRSRAAI